MARKVADIYLEDKLEPKQKKTIAAVAVDRDLLERYCGDYLLEVGVMAQVKREGEQLVITTPGGKHTLRAVSKTEFVDDAREVRMVFTASEKGMKAELHVAAQQLDGRQLQAPAQLTDAELKALTGDFYSDELEVFFHLVDKDGKIWLRHRKGEFSLRPIAADEMLGDFGEYGGMVTLRFSRDGDKVTGFALGSGRVKGLKFARATVERVR
jgi:hypothetical protein